MIIFAKSFNYSATHVLQSLKLVNSICRGTLVDAVAVVNF